VGVERPKRRFPMPQYTVMIFERGRLNGYR